MADDKFMTTGDALESVHAQAQAHLAEHGDAGREQLALDVVHDLIVNNFSGDNEQTDYVEHKGLRCPYCGSGNVAPTTNPELSSDPAEITMMMGCDNPKCGKGWTEYYRLTGFRE
jgi:hypothetical protein